MWLGIELPVRNSATSLENELQLLSRRLYFSGLQRKNIKQEIVRWSYSAWRPPFFTCQFPLMWSIKHLIWSCNSHNWPVLILTLVTDYIHWQAGIRERSLDKNKHKCKMIKNSETNIRKLSLQVKQVLHEYFLRYLCFTKIFNLQRRTHNRSSLSRNVSHKETLI